MISFLAVAVLAVGLGIVFGWKGVLAPLLGFAIWQVLAASLRSMALDERAENPSGPDPEPVTADERTLYWCEECGTEVMLVIRGSGKPPRHCGERMHERAEMMRSQEG